MADDLYNLELLSLIAKITQEVLNHTGINDKTLAEFIISLHDESKTLADFKQKLHDVGADFPASFVENIGRLILTLHPKHKKKYSSNNGVKEKGKGTAGTDEAEKARRMFPGLALPDQDPASADQDAISKEVDDMILQLESVAKKSRPPPELEEPAYKRQRTARSRSPPRRRSTSPRSRDGLHEQRGRGRGRAPLDERPVLYKIYDGKVNGLKEFGAFVTLEGVAQRVEGIEFHLMLPIGC